MVRICLLILTVLALSMMGADAKAGRPNLREEKNLQLVNMGRKLGRKLENNYNQQGNNYASYNQQGNDYQNWVNQYNGYANNNGYGGNGNYNNDDGNGNNNGGNGNGNNNGADGYWNDNGEYVYYDDEVAAEAAENQDDLYADDANQNDYANEGYWDNEGNWVEYEDYDMDEDEGGDDDRSETNYNNLLQVHNMMELYRLTTAILAFLMFLMALYICYIRRQAYITKASLSQPLTPMSSKTPYSLPMTGKAATVI